MNDLIGKKIINITLSALREFLFVETEEYIYTYYAKGDCCSDSWIEHIDNPDSIIGQIITEIVDSEGVPKEDEDLSKFDCLQVYKTTLKTEKTTFDIEYRNNSNGYYGGYLMLAGMIEKR